MGAITFKDYNEEFLSEAQNSVSLYSLNQKVDDESATLQSSSSVPLFSTAFFFFKNVCLQCYHEGYYKCRFRSCVRLIT